MFKQTALFIYITVVLLMFVGGKIYTVWETHLLTQRADSFEREMREFMNRGDRFTGAEGRAMSERIDTLEERMSTLESKTKQ